MQIWQTIKGFEDYEVGSEGQVRRGYNLLKPMTDSAGYKSVNLSKGSTRRKINIHTLVAKAFLLGGQEMPSHRCVIFLDKDKSNPQLSNLKIVSLRGRARHYYQLTEEKEQFVREFLMYLYQKNGGKPLQFAGVKNQLGIQAHAIRRIAEEEGVRFTKKTITKVYEYKGDTGTLPYFAKKYEISYQTLYTRVTRLQWGLEQAITTPVLRHDIQSNS